MFFVTSNYAQFSDPWGGGSTGAPKQDALTPIDDNGGTLIPPTFGGNTMSPSINTSPDMTTLDAPPPPPSGGGGGNDNVPIDGGITLLFAAGIGKGLKSYKLKQKANR